MLPEFDVLETALNAFVKVDFGNLEPDTKQELATNLHRLRNRIGHQLGTVHKKLNKVRRQYVRHTTIPLEEGFALLRSGLDTQIIAGESVNTSVSLRLKTFLDKGVHCEYPDCNLKASFFAVEKSDSGHHEYGRFHLNLYAVHPQGHEVMWTHDHIKARSLGGRDSIENCQPMCQKHNEKKARKECLMAELMRLSVDDPMCEECNGTQIVLEVPKVGNIQTTLCKKCEPKGL